MLESNCLVCKKYFIYKKSGYKGMFCSKICKYKSNHWALKSDAEKLKIITVKFEKNVEKVEGCWKWKGSKINTGYGFIRYGRDSNGFFLLAHRASFLIHYGYLPENLFIAHRCDLPECCNPSHLFPASPKENTQDMWNKGRNKGNFVKGITPHNIKASKEIVLKIKHFLSKKMLQKEIANILNISINIIKDVSRGKTWKNLEN